MSPKMLQVNDEDLNVSRYKRHLSGETYEQIAETDGITRTEALRTVAAGKNLVNGELVRKIADKRIVSSLAREELRGEAMERLGKKVIDSLKKLLDGKRIVVYKDKLTGAVRMEEVDDPKMIVMGIEKFCKVTSLEEKPAVQQTVVNVQQNTIPVGGHRMDFEGMLAKIRQERLEEKQKLIEGEVTDVTDAGEANETNELNEIKDEVKDVREEEDEWDF
jgi:hypothetical protein